jgi:putative DNA methylase
LTAYKPKLIEVALPLAAINAEAAREKSIRHGHPSTLHLWWARRPLAAARAVIWSSLVDDPAGDDTLTSEQQDAERTRLFGILERLVKWENSNDSHVLAEARAEIERCFPDGPPPILDPFGGGGAIPLEAQRLGLTALSGDLNPVAVLIQKAMIEIPPRFGGRSPVHPDTVDNGLGSWTGAHGLAADVEAYGRWMRGEALRRIGHLYPDATAPGGEKLTPIAWIWARTVESPDPTWNGHVPLVASWELAKPSGKPVTWILPKVDVTSQRITYEVRVGGSPAHGRTVKGGNGTCLATGAAMPAKYLRQQAQAGQFGQQLMAVVAEGDRGRCYLSPSPEHEQAVKAAVPAWQPLQQVPTENHEVDRLPMYGMATWGEAFTPRQLVALTTFSDLLDDVRTRVRNDAIAAGTPDDGVHLRDGGSGATAYSEAIVTYLSFVIDKCADYWSSIATWDNTKGETVRNTFGRQAIPMAWNFVEAYPFSSSTGSFGRILTAVAKAVTRLPAEGRGEVAQRDARARVRECPGAAISSDPPYYDNISYADLSDFFFVWLRRNLATVWPDECATLLTPKADELIANRYRAGSKEKAERHFEAGMAEFMKEVAKAQPTGVPATIYYAYKATETKDGELRSTGWDTFLQGVLDAGLQVNATWPMRTELGNRLIASKSNALASSIVLACRPRAASAPLASRGEFVGALREELPEAVRLLQSGNIAPVDIAQSTIGPGIKVFSRYAKVVEADGSAMSVSDALAIINDVLGEVIDGEEAELDADTRFAATWYAQQGYNPGRSGDADGQARAKNTSLSGIEAAGIGEARGGSFRLFERSELDPEWDVVADTRLTVWEATQHLVAALERSESEAADLLHRLGGYGDRARQLAYVLFQKATEKGWAEEAGAYNGLILAWPALQSMGSSTDQDAQQQLL